MAFNSKGIFLLGKGLWRERKVSWWLGGCLGYLLDGFGGVDHRKCESFFWDGLRGEWGVSNANFYLSTVIKNFVTHVYLYLNIC